VGPAGVDDEGVPVGGHRAAEPAGRRAVGERPRGGGRCGEVVDGDDVQVAAAFEQRPQHVASDAAESVDGDACPERAPPSALGFACGTGRRQHAALVDEQDVLVDPDQGMPRRERPRAVPVRRGAPAVEQARDGRREGARGDRGEPRAAVREPVTGAETTSAHTSASSPWATW
jgi:hypothetical protein